MAFLIREATLQDLPELARLHVKTWRDTYEGILTERELNVPTVEIRERQWRKTLAEEDNRVFCFVVENEQAALVGFASGKPHDSGDFAGQLSKIYLLHEYQRQGLGSRLMGHVARRFLACGVVSMILFAEARNPSCRFYEALGGEALPDDKGEVSGAYGWRDLLSLASACPTQ